MYQIEELMLEAIRERREFHSRNTSFVFNKSENRWYLFVHGHRIATFDCKKRDAEPETISLQGPVSRTICSRLNALDGIRVYLRNK